MPYLCACVCVCVACVCLSLCVRVCIVMPYVCFSTYANNPSKIANMYLIINVPTIEPNFPIGLNNYRISMIFRSLWGVPLASAGGPAVNICRLGSAVRTSVSNTGWKKEKGFAALPEKYWFPMQDFTVMENVVSEEQATVLLKDMERALRRRRYEKDHWDAVIVNFREVCLSVSLYRCTLTLFLFLPPIPPPNNTHTHTHTHIGIERLLTAGMLYAASC